jgi:glycerol-3-phosphate acyltransferase PlsY
MSLAASTLVASVAGYLLGGVPFGLIISRLKGCDVRRVGSGNIGAANVGRVLGLRWGVAVFVLDMLKGLIPALAAGRVLLPVQTGESGDDMIRLVAWLLVATCPVLGHVCSPFLGFRGGKGVSTSLGAALGVYPHLIYPVVASLVVWVLAVLLTRTSSMGSIASAITLPLACMALATVDGRGVAVPWPLVTFTWLLAVIVVARHRDNLERIWSGTERRMGRLDAGSPSQTSDSENGGNSCSIGKR